MLKLAVLYAFVSFAITFIMVYAFIRIMKNIKLFQPIRDVGPESHKISKKQTITMGGIPIFAGFSVVCLATNICKYEFVSIVMFISSLCMLLGLSDDLSKVFYSSYKGMLARHKLLFQLGITVILWWLLKKKIYGEDAFSDNVFLMFLVLAGSMNAVNLTDGLDGLAGGMMIFVLAGFSLIAWLKGLTGLMLMLFVLVGALFGFLYFNVHPAAIFMGDTGSMFLGGVMGSVAIILHEEFLLIIMAGLFIWETLSVIMQVVSFKLTGKRIFRMSPFHHHLELAGWGEESIVYLFWVVSGFLVFLALCLV